MIEIVPFAVTPPDGPCSSGSLINSLLLSNNLAKLIDAMCLGSHSLRRVKQDFVSISPEEGLRGPHVTARRTHNLANGIERVSLPNAEVCDAVAADITRSIKHAPQHPAHQRPPCPLARLWPHVLFPYATNLFWLSGSASSR